MRNNSIFKYFQNYYDGFVQLIYPRVCPSCGNALFRNEKLLCTYCLYNLPKTNFHTIENNPINELFVGRVRIEHSAALFHFHKRGRVQRLLHQLKYKGRTDIAVFLGEILGKDLSKNELFSQIDCIIPVPLHKDRLRERGYNQSEQIAIGLSKSMKVPIDTTSLVRNKFTHTQTKKTQQARWENVKTAFEVINTKALENKNILLVDDVITTGSTIESCVKVINEIENTKVFIACLGFASN